VRTLVLRSATVASARGSRWRRAGQQPGPIAPLAAADACAGNAAVGHHRAGRDNGEGDQPAARLRLCDLQGGGQGEGRDRRGTYYNGAQGAHRGPCSAAAPRRVAACWPARAMSLQAAPLQRRPDTRCWACGRCWSGSEVARAAVLQPRRGPTRCPARAQVDVKKSVPQESKPRSKKVFVGGLAAGTTTGAPGSGRAAPGAPLGGRPRSPAQRTAPRLACGLTRARARARRGAHPVRWGGWGRGGRADHAGPPVQAQPRVWVRPAARPAPAVPAHRPRGLLSAGLARAPGSSHLRTRRAPRL